MKIQKLLTEDSAVASFGALTPFHISTLKRIANGRLDPFSEVSPQTQELLDDLVDLGMLDTTYDVTSSGVKAIRMSSQVGTQDLRDAKRKAMARRAIASREQPVKDVEVDLDDEEDFEPEEEFSSSDEDLGGTLRTEPKKPSKIDRVKPLRKDDFGSFKDKEDFMDDEFDWEE